MVCTYRVYIVASHFVEPVRIRRENTFGLVILVAARQATLWSRDLNATRIIQWFVRIVTDFYDIFCIRTSLS